MKTFSTLCTLMLYFAIVNLAPMKEIDPDLCLLLKGIMVETTNTYTKKIMETQVPDIGKGPERCEVDFFCLAEKSLKNVKTTDWSLTDHLKQYNMKDKDKPEDCRFKTDATVSIKTILKEIQYCAKTKFDNDCSKCKVGGPGMQRRCYPTPKTDTQV